MTVQVSELAQVLQTLFTEDAEDAAAATGFVRRRRKLTGPLFAQALVFGWLRQPKAALPDLAELAGQLGAPVTASALDQRFTPSAAAFLQALLASALGYACRGNPQADPSSLLGRFTGLYIDDSTTISLPAALAEFFPGCGGSAGGGAAALKVPLRLELLSGELAVADLQPGRANDLAGPLPHAPLPRGSLRLADLGYFSLDGLREYDEQGVTVVSRLPARVNLRDEEGRACKLHEFLASQRGSQVDGWVEVGARQRLRLRLVAWRVPEAVARKRRQRLAKQAQKKGRPASAAQKVLCDWTVLVTNAPAALLGLLELCVLARLRWQVEWLFRVWKSQGGLDESAGQRPYRVLCEVLAKLLGQVVRHWLLLSGGTLLRQSQPRAALRVQWAAEALAKALTDLAALEQVLAELQARLRELPGKQRRRGRPAAFQLADNPYDLELDYLSAA